MTYQNLPENSAAMMQHRGRLETVTPNRLSEKYREQMMGLEGSDGSGEFKRSASARLHRNKKNYPEMINQSVDQQQQQHGMEDSRKKEQVNKKNDIPTPGH